MSRPALPLAPLALAASLLVAGCDDYLAGQADYSARVCSREPPLTYENFGKGYLGKWCVGCHSSLLVRESQRSGAPMAVDFDTWSGVLLWADRIEARAVPIDGGMPPAGEATEEERALLEEWLRCEVLPAAQEEG